MKSDNVRSLITVRHSLTAHNVLGIITGRLDEPLSEEGRAAARHFAQSQGPLSADVVLSSPAQRAIETAKLVTRLPEGDVVLDERCHERDYGVLQGLTREQVTDYQTEITYLEAGGVRHSLNPPDGETLHQVRARACRFLQAIRQLPARSVLVSSHQSFLQQVHGLLLHRSLTETLACHVRSLQVDCFTLQAGGKPQHRPVHPGLSAGLLW